jgi:hypothetical protein
MMLPQTDIPLEQAKQPYFISNSTAVSGTWSAKQYNPNQSITLI